MTNFASLREELQKLKADKDQCEKKGTCYHCSLNAMDWLFHRRTYKALLEALQMAEKWTAEEIEIKRILRGHTKIGCSCRYCKSVLNGRIVLHEG